MKVLVLGANGFIGSHVVDALSTKGISVRAFARPNPDQGNRFNESANVEFFSGDFFNQDDLTHALEGISHVVHAISVTNPATADNDPYIDIELNVRSSVELMQRCTESESVGRIIFLSSGGSIYGNDELGRPFNENDPAQPFSPYAIGKLTIENYLRYFKMRYDLGYTILRVANPYGPRQAFWKHQGVVSTFLQRILRNEPITVLGDGSMVRDYIYIGDVAEMIAEVTLNNQPRHDIYNIASGAGVTLNQLIADIESVTGEHATIERVEAPKSFVHTSSLDVSRFNEDYTTRAMVEMRQGLGLTLNDLKLHSKLD